MALPRPALHRQPRCEIQSFHRQDRGFTEQGPSPSHCLVFQEPPDRTSNASMGVYGKPAVHTRPPRCRPRNRTFTLLPAEGRPGSFCVCEQRRSYLTESRFSPLRPLCLAGLAPSCSPAPGPSLHASVLCSLCPGHRPALKPSVAPQCLQGKVQTLPPHTGAFPGGLCPSPQHAMVVLLSGHTPTPPSSHSPTLWSFRGPPPLLLPPRGLCAALHQRPSLAWTCIPGVAFSSSVPPSSSMGPFS